MRVVVIGASGFLGGAVVKRLTDSGFDCLGVSRKALPGLYPVTNYSDAPEGDFLIHLAETSDRFAANAGGAALESEAHDTLEALLAKRYRKVIYASSAVVYGDRGTTPRKVSDPVEAVDTYTRIKLASEKAVVARGGAAARLSNLYGPGMAASNVLSHILNQLGRGPTITMDALEPVRDFLWVEDAALVLARMIAHESGGLFNVGSGKGTSIRELVDLAQAAAATRQHVAALHMLDHPSRRILDIAATTQALGWAPRTGLEEGVRKLVNMKMKVETPYL